MCTFTTKFCVPDNACWSGSKIGIPMEMYLNKMAIISDLHKISVSQLCMHLATIPLNDLITGTELGC